MPLRRVGRRSPRRSSSRHAAWSKRSSASCSSTPAPGGSTATQPLIFRRFGPMRIAILDPAAGISGDMTLGALLSVGVPASWLEELPRRLALAGVEVTIREVRRGGGRGSPGEFVGPRAAQGGGGGEVGRPGAGGPVAGLV